jgi:threonine/homoserine/homoserine lactone efflux protein
MIPIESLLLFLPVALLLVLAPGPDFVFVSTTAAIGGVRAGLLATTGICLAMSVHVTLSGLGVAELLRLYPLAFELIRWAGAAYLLVLAWSALRTRESDGVKAGARNRGKFGYVAQGFLTNLLNPKAAIITSLVFMQFVDLSRGNLFPQFLTLGAIIVAQMFVVYAILSFSLAKASAMAARHSWIGRIAAKLVGAMFVGFAVRMILLERPR